MDKWNIVIQKGATYQQSITVDGVADIASATLWRVRIATPVNGVIVEATTSNGMIVAGTAANNKVLTLTPTTTGALPLGNGTFDFEVEWSSGTIIRRYVSNGLVQVNPKAGN
jgi:hypothetical protein